ncbi:MAG: NUDIX hydrolase [Candidatus Woesebacteria bacterium GW2011_GWF1_31_35]|uniref:NUDIX hydrolase n=1 Tax=Candidatus Woesebacteria bacterium GW2011_GWC2_31_9 TaxID=1618586 RepID=A0A0G0BLU7_9BACT|nr:MAG: NUDIX hydrolase [Candidatus Woesebacteria bacterium GW2011_GWF1_31_35]KKP23190.1 MAG: NUDIX hydrolase [Candidatus Woesebacteria bacterium GW2011_GWC1_30_29]KKP26878.1 MAG: NUDIX hydrolase [Candidatus Woesebacteria bacterium GW2011_GWD1_31_12]KKP27452.1 MAG: NUDIX hydrolase [Candidatus Woesebacteria bacterium GW2011_GWB1_31_29]KKP32032.1 MAG: NUDIX hydrolase [Candidatus Woesebacteria bacterium GW2011_GWC2_31_9]KKP32486.1 MAG: NUDIX hydrolase [Candidatus Woesebacteria bacterium GW2011_GW
MGKVKQEKIIREFSSGGVVFKKNKWLVTKSSVSDLYPKAVWRLPKGWIDEGETLEETAIREVKEEGGVEAKIIDKIETIKYFYSSSGKGRILKFVTFFLMEWTKDLIGGFGDETSKTIWLPFEKAYKLLSFSSEKQILKEAKEILTRGL